MNACSHLWTMADMRSGYLVVEGCYHCGARTSFFSDEPAYRWTSTARARTAGSTSPAPRRSPSTCAASAAGSTVDLSDMAGLMLSTCEDPSAAWVG